MSNLRSDYQSLRDGGRPRASLSPLMKSFTLTDAERQDLIAFLESLTAEKCPKHLCPFSRLSGGVESMTVRTKIFVPIVSALTLAFPAEGSARLGGDSTTTRSKPGFTAPMRCMI